MAGRKATPGTRKVTSPKIATRAAKQLANPNTPKKYRGVDASATAQAGGKTRRKQR